MNEKDIKSHISFLVILFICIAAFLIGTRFNAKFPNKTKADFVGSTVAIWEYIERDIQLDYFYHLDSKATYEQVRKEIGEPNGMRGSDTVLPYYQVDDDLYVVISFSMDESGEYDKIETMLLCTENEDLDKIYPK